MLAVSEFSAQGQVLERTAYHYGRGGAV